MKLSMLIRVNIVSKLPCITTFLMDEALLSIILASRALLVKMLITLEPHCIFGSNFVYLYILTLSCHWYQKMGPIGFTEHHFGQSSIYGKNAHNS